jgi:hypothetical protein
VAATVRSAKIWVDRRRGGWSPKPTLLGSSPSRPANLFRRGLLASRPSSELARTVVRFHPPEPFRSAVAVQVLHLAFDSRHCWFESNPLNQFDYVHQANPTESASQVGTCTNYLVSDLSAAPPAPAPDFARSAPPVWSERLIQDRKRRLLYVLTVRFWRLRR